MLFLLKPFVYSDINGDIEFLGKVNNALLLKQKEYVFNYNIHTSFGSCSCSRTYSSLSSESSVSQNAASALSRCWRAAPGIRGPYTSPGTDTVSDLDSPER